MSYISLDQFFEAIPRHVQKLLKRAADYSEKEQWEIAFTLSTIALEKLENSLESDSWNVGLILSIVGCINTKANKYNDAESLWKRAISIFENHNGGAHPQTVVRILWDIFAVYFKNERHETVIFIGEIIIGICEKHQRRFDLLEAHRVVMQKALQHLKQLDEAKKFLHAILPVYADKFGIRKIEDEKVFELLKIVYFCRNNIIKSEKMFEINYVLPDAILLSCLGVLCDDENFLGKAFKYFQRVIKIHENKGLPNHSQLVERTMTVAIFYLALGIGQSTKLSLNKNHVMGRTKYADNYRMMLYDKTDLAFSYVQSGLLSEARRVYEEFLRDVYTDENDVPILKSAEEYEESGKDKVPILDEKSEIIDRSLRNLSALYVLDGKYKAAKALQDLVEPEDDGMDTDEI